MSETQLPEGWRMVKFGDMAKHISKRVEPSETNLNIYVGLEHLDPDSLRIKRHGVPSDVEGQKLLVKKGQIIFGKRRAYQRKLGVADWDCICSAHAMVLEAKPETVLPEFLPFFMQSDAFMNRAIAISEGSLSPTIKWKALENQVFAMPDITIQLSIIRIFNKIEDCFKHIQHTKSIIENILFLLRQNVKNNEKGDSGILEDFVSLKGGNAFKEKYQGAQVGDLPFIKVSDMNLPNNEKFIVDSSNWISNSQINEIRPNIFPKGSTVFAKVGAALLLNRRRILTRDTAIDNNMMAAVPIKNILPEYLYHFLCSLDFKDYVQSGALPSVNQNVIGKIQLSVPEIDFQINISNIISEFESLNEVLSDRFVRMQNLKNSIFRSYREV
ncbi:restriction endonuclease subunit S [Methylotuvimicrobium sp. KM1]|uniref:restriction endonuclease subunit S n=1 Tax=Methylotuvimicrobium sp. KM1 TaxID=3377707 RepID=UPI00384F417C